MIRFITVLLFVLFLISGLSGCAGLLFGGAAATGVNAIHDRRTAGTMLDDQNIEFNSYITFRKTEELASAERAHINVTSYNNAVLLSGEVITPELRQLAEDKIRTVSKVRFIHNELAVGQPSSLQSRATDTVITAGVKASLFKIGDIPNFDPTRVKVVTERGTVYLFGLVTTQEAEAVTETVRRVNGVQQVVKLFEYID
jgi:osmotically-inducible protein OsmY